MNIIILAYIKKLGLVICKIDNGPQKIDKTTLFTYNIAIESFSL